VFWTQLFLLLFFDIWNPILQTRPKSTNLRTAEKFPQIKMRTAKKRVEKNMKKKISHLSTSFSGPQFSKNCRPVRILICGNFSAVRKIVDFGLVCKIKISVLQIWRSADNSGNSRNYTNLIIHALRADKRSLCKYVLKCPIL